MTDRETVEQLANMLNSWDIDWEPSFRDTPWRRTRRPKRFGL